MPISRRQFENIMDMVVAWANDVPFRNWFQLLKETYAWTDQDTEPDYIIVEVPGGLYLWDPYETKRCMHARSGHGHLYAKLGTMHSLDMTTYMESSLNPPSMSGNDRLPDLHTSKDTESGN